MSLSSHPDDPAMLMPNETIEEYVSRSMAKFYLLETRSEIPSGKDIRRLEDSCKEIIEVIKKAATGTRNDTFLHLVRSCQQVHLFVFGLRKLQDKESEKEEHVTYANHMFNILNDLLKASFDDEMRRLLVVFGMVTALAELFITEITVFTVNPSTEVHPDARVAIRRTIANLLTNLVYGNTAAKRLLTKYSGFTEKITELIQDSPALTFFYAALVRNLSWNAEATTRNYLATVVPALTAAAVRAHQNGDNKCLQAVLSALWNLGSHSAENKRIICESKKFLPLVISLLNCNPQNTLMVESASGIIKYACGYLAERPELFNQATEGKLIRQIFPLLVDQASFTVVSNALSALAQLTALNKDIQKQIATSEKIMNVLERLRHSKREDIRSVVKTILGHIHCSYGSHSLPHSARMPPPGAAATAMYYDQFAYPGQMPMTLLPNRQRYPFAYPHPTSYSHHETLPRSARVFPEPTPLDLSFQAPMSSMMPPPRAAPSSARSGFHSSRAPSMPPSSSRGNEKVFMEPGDVTLEAGQLVPDSLIGTRSGSFESLTFETQEAELDQKQKHDSSFNSTNASSCAHSASGSEDDDIPSPSEFAAIQYAKQQAKLGHRSLDDSGNDRDLTRNGYLCDYEENQYENTFVDGSALKSAIDDAYPKPQSCHTLQSTPRLPKPAVFAPPPQPTAPLSQELPQSPDCSSDIDFDDSSITEEPTPPRASATSSLVSDDSSNATTAADTTVTKLSASKNGPASTMATSDPLCLHPRSPAAAVTMPSSRMSLAGSVLVEAATTTTTENHMAASSLLQSPRTTERVRDARRLCESQSNDWEDEEDGVLSDDSYRCNSTEVVPLEDLTALPDDVNQAFQAERLVIDCSSLTKSTRTASRLPRQDTYRKSSSSDQGSVQNVKIGLLSAATIKRLSKSRNPLPMVSTKSTPTRPSSAAKAGTPGRAARVSPFNYKEPTVVATRENGKSSPPRPSGTPGNGNKLLVTTV